MKPDEVQSNKTEHVSHRRILIFGVLRMEEMLAKGNAWQLSAYESYFSEVHVCYLVGAKPVRLTRGKTLLVSIGSKSRIGDAILAPWHLYRYVKNQGPFDVIQTPDIVYAWWTTFLVRLLLRAPILVMPVAIPEQLYADSGKSLSGLPIIVERAMVNATFHIAHRIVTGHSFGGFVEWLGNDHRTSHKLLVLESVPDGVIDQGFVEQTLATPNQAERPFILVCVSRLHHEKLLDDLIALMFKLRARGLGPDQVRMVLIGDGPLAPQLKADVDGKGLRDQFQFVGAVPNHDVAKYLVSASAFVSPLTGSSAREAMFCRLPVVAYDRDWVHGTLMHGRDCLLVRNRDVEGLANAVELLMSNAELRVQLGINARTLAERLWTLQGCAGACEQIHQAYIVR